MTVQHELLHALWGLHHHEMPCDLITIPCGNPVDLRERPMTNIRIVGR